MIVNALYSNVWRIIARALAQISGQYTNKIFYEVAPSEVPYPYLVYLSESALGYNFGMLNSTAWKGIITLKSVATSIASASDALGELSNGFTHPFTVSGIPNIAIPYTVQFFPCKAYSFPVDRFNNVAVYTSAIGVETYITPQN